MTAPASRLRLYPLDFEAANEFVRRHHRHNTPVMGHKFSIGAEADGDRDVERAVCGRGGRYRGRGGAGVYVC